MEADLYQSGPLVETHSGSWFCHLEVIRLAVISAYLPAPVY